MLKKRALTLSLTLLVLIPLASTAFAQVLTRPPVLLVSNEEGSVPVHVQSLDVDVHISGFLAQTTLTMTFHNPNDRVLEGQLVFPLPEGATISGFGLDVGGELVDGVVVERQRARVAFEAETRINVDPGLAEWVQGSVFRTRIYPFPAEGNRTIRVSYVSDLTVAEGGATTYHLPLAYQEELDNFHVRLAVASGETEPTVEANSLGTLEFGDWESQFVAEMELTNVTPDEDLVVLVPETSSKPLIELGEDGYTYFSFFDLLPQLSATTERPDPERIVILFDGSTSRADADLESEMRLVSNWLGQLGETHVDLIVLRDRLSEVLSFPASESRADDLVAALLAEPLDGGTDFHDLHFPSQLSELISGGATDTVDVYVLMSDGLGSLGEPERLVPETPVIAITSSANANHAWLRDVAESSGGAYVNLQRLSDEEALEAVSTTPLRLVGIETEPGSVELVELSSPLPDGGRVMVSGRLLVDETTITLNYALGNERVHQSTIALSTSDVTEGDLVSRHWAQLRISSLALSPDRMRDELLALGQQFNLVTPHTSYIVLETLDQHLEHGIPPAESRGSMLAEYEAQMGQRTESEAVREAAQLNSVVNNWYARVQWWEAPAPTVEPVRPDPELVEVPTEFLPEATEEEPLLYEFQEAERRSEDFEDEGEGNWDGVQGLGSISGNMPAPGAGFGAGEDMDETVSRESSGSNAGGSEDSGSDATITIQEWRPDTPYLVSMESVSDDEAYEVYLENRAEFELSPAFYLDVASYLYQIERPIEARRVLTNISELELADARLLRIIAYKLQEEGDLDLAIRVFEEVYDLRPEEPQSMRDLALALSDRADMLADGEQLPDPEAPLHDWARAVDLIDELVRSDTGRFNTIEMPAIMEANRNIARMERYAEDVLGGAELPSFNLDSRLRQNLDLDVRVILRWDTDQTDMDLWVTEPSGERCYYGNQDTAYGATYGRDYTGGYGPEEYLIRNAPDGGYFVQANYFGSRQQALTGGTTLQVDIYTNWGRPDEERHTTTVRLTATGETIDIGTVAMGEDGAALPQ